MEDDNVVDITIFVPCYNEEKNIVNTLNTIVTTFKNINLKYEVIVVDDCSVDKTYEIVESYVREHEDINLILHRQPKNMGLSYNFAEAAFLGRGKYFRQVNGDNDETVETLKKVLGCIGKARIIIPYHETAAARNINRRIISRVYTVLINIISGHKINYYNGLSIYYITDVRRWHSRSRGYGYQAELITNLLHAGASYIQVPVVASARSFGESKAFTIKNLLSISHTMVKIILGKFSFIYNNQISSAL